MEIDIEKLSKEKKEKFLAGLGSLMREAFKHDFKYTDIKSYEDAVKFKPVIEEDIIRSTDSYSIQCYKMLAHIASCINDPSYIADYFNSNQKKWRVWINFSSGVRFNGSHFVYSFAGANSGFGSRLCTLSREKTLHATSILEEQFKKIILRTKK